jgi:hypothetical protein
MESFYNKFGVVVISLQPYGGIRHVGQIAEPISKLDGIRLLAKLKICNSIAYDRYHQEIDSSWQLLKLPI